MVQRIVDAYEREDRRRRGEDVLPAPRPEDPLAGRALARAAVLRRPRVRRAAPPDAGPRPASAAVAGARGTAALAIRVERPPGGRRRLRRPRPARGPRGCPPGRGPRPLLRRGGRPGDVRPPRAVPGPPWADRRRWPSPWRPGRRPLGGGGGLRGHRPAGGGARGGIRRTMSSCSTWSTGRSTSSGTTTTQAAARRRMRRAEREVLAALGRPRPLFARPPRPRRDRP